MPSSRTLAAAEADADAEEAAGPLGAEAPGVAAAEAALPLGPAPGDVGAGSAALELLDPQAVMPRTTAAAVPNPAKRLTAPPMLESSRVRPCGK
jgi:hypothetical protein